MSTCSAFVSSSTYASILRQCSSSKNLDEGRRVHADLIARGRDADTFLGNLVVQMYDKCGSLDEALEAFNSIRCPNVFSFTILITALVHHGRPKAALQAFQRMDLEGVQADYVALVGGVAALSMVFEQEGNRFPTNMVQGKAMHCRVRESGLGSNVVLGNSLITMYRKTGSLVEARKVFDAMPNKDIVSWNSMISGYAENGLYLEAVMLYNELVPRGSRTGVVKPDETTFASVLGCCSCLDHGKRIHQLVAEYGFHSDVFVCNSLVSMYARCGSLELARQVFDAIKQRNSVSWNIMILGYADNGEGSKAMALFGQMKLEASPVKPDHVTFINVLTSCSTAEEVHQVHQEISAAGLESVSTVANALVSTYARCGKVDAAMEAFDKLKSKDVVSWNGIIAGCAQQGYYSKAVDYFRAMDLEGVKPGEGTFSCVLSACAALGALGEGRRLHARVVTCGYELSILVASTLIHMYGKCGRLDEAQKLFDRLQDRTVVPWNALIAAYAQHGYAKEALDLFHDMDVEPNAITYTGVLHACCHSGLVEAGCRYFGSMVTDYRIVPSEEHCRMAVDLLARVGKLDDAEKFMNKMPSTASQAGSWRALLAACMLQGDWARGARAAQKIMNLEPESSSLYVLLANMHSAAGRVDEAATLRRLRDSKGVTEPEEAGCSSIEVKSRVHTFLSDDHSHPKSAEIGKTLSKLSKAMEEAGYHVLDTGEEEKSRMLCYHHSEKLAIAFGINSTPTGTPLHIVKNFRVCTDCHSAIKFISKLVGRLITVRDASCFHRFQDGGCSCCDFW